MPIKTVSREAKAAAEAVKRALGRRIAALRRERGLNRSELAAKIGVHPDTLSRYEQGRGGVPIDRLYAIGAALGVDAAALVPRPRRRKVDSPEGG